MTVDTIYTPAEYTGDGVTTEFALSHLVYDSSHLIVTIDAVETGAWSATGYGLGSGVTVTMDTAPADGEEVVVQRVVPYTQDTDLENFDGNPADVTEKQFDLLAMADQQLSETGSRTVLIPIGASVATNEIIGTITGATQILTMTTSGPAVSSLTSLSSTLDTVFTVLSSGDYMQYDGSNWVNKTEAQVKTSLGLKLNNYAATSAPTVGDDSGDGYDIGSRWFDITNDKAYVCIDASVGAAVWKDDALTVADLGSAATKGFIDDDSFATATDSNIPSSESVKAYVDGGASYSSLASQTASGDSAIDITTGLDGTYDVVHIDLINVVPATDAVSFEILVSTDGGSSFKTGASDYAWGVVMNDTGTGADGDVDQDDDSMRVTGFVDVGSDTGEAINGRVTIYEPSNASLFTYLKWEVVFRSAAGDHRTVSGGGTYKAATAVNGLRFQMNSGNIESGKFKTRAIRN